MEEERFVWSIWLKLHSGKYSQLDKAGKGGRNEGAAEKLGTRGKPPKNLQIAQKYFFLPQSGLLWWDEKGTGCGSLFCLPKEIGGGCCRWKRRLVKTLEFKFNFFTAFFHPPVQTL